MRPPTSSDLQRVFAEQNPWHVSGEVPIHLARQRERALGASLWSGLVADEPRRYHVVLGPRRVGKTTALYQTVRHLLHKGVPAGRLWWLRLDHPVLMRVALGDLVREVCRRSKATSEQPVFLMLDELIYSEEWDSWLKTFYDDNWPVRIAATSSAAAALREGRRESGIGRWLEHYLPPYRFGEFVTLMGESVEIDTGPTLASTLTRLEEARRGTERLASLRRAFLFVGGFPELLLGQGDWADGDETSRLLASQQILRSDAVERAVYKDIPQSFPMDDPMLLERLLYTLAAQVTGLVSPSGLSRDLGISQPTIGRYISFLEQAFLLFEAPNYSGSEATVQKRGRKVYFVDGAVRNAALQRGIAPLSDPVEMGLLLENLVMSSLQSLAHAEGARLYHWRDGKKEVDGVWTQPSDAVVFEIGSSLSHSRKGLESFLIANPRFDGHAYLITPDADVVQPGTGEEIGTLPLDLMLVAIDARARAAEAATFGVSSQTRLRL